MRWLRRHLGFAGLLLGCAVIAISEVACTYAEFNKARFFDERLRRAQAELRAMASVRAALTSEVTAQIQSDLAASEDAWKKLRAELIAVDDRPAGFDLPAPIERADGYFDIASFIERMRESAERRGVTVDQQERFGFSEYAHNGPEVADLPRVYRERCATESLLLQLFETQPHRLLAVQRERRTAADASLNKPERDRGDPAGRDYFDWDPRESVRLPNAVNTFAIRVSFVSQTLSLRLLLNQLAASELPFVVRNVEVAPAERAQVSLSAGQIDPAGIAPLVGRSLSRFTVTVELIELVESPGLGG